MNIINRPLLLDLFCGAGGASMGYYQAGFDILGVDEKFQPRYPFKFHHGDVFEFLEEWGNENMFVAIHASPPCQAYSNANKYWRKSGGKTYPDLIDRVRTILKKINKPYIIENVKSSPLINPILLNGRFFELKLRRARIFETSFPIPLVFPKEEEKGVKMGRKVEEGEVITPVGHFTSVPYARKVMGIDWMYQKELAQAIPPVYTKFIGEYLYNLIKGEL